MDARSRHFIKQLSFILAVLGFTSLAQAFDGPAPTSRAPTPEQVRSVSSTRIVFSYRLADDSGDASRAELWYKKELGKLWMAAKVIDSDGSLIFDADGDGLFGFFIILHNTAGASSPPPAADTSPQHWIRVDRSLPSVQALSIRPDPRFAVNRDLHLRWSATDDNLSDRPVSLHYRTEQTKSFKPIADCLSPRGAYRWSAPTDVTGRLELKFSATDRAGNTGTYIAEIEQAGVGKATSQPTPSDDFREAANPTPVKKSVKPRREGDTSVFRSAAYDEPDAGEEAAQEAASKESRRRYEAGTWHRIRGDYDLAIARYRESIELMPREMPPRVDLAGVLMLRGDADAAERELQKALVIDPTYRSALKSLALVQAKKRNYKSARETLDKVLLHDPRDAEAWLAYGDVVMFMGDRAAARQAWSKAQSLPEADKDVSNRAAKRLDMYPDSRPENEPG
ncbi:MAG: tetratricopeptide repeat protein [Planctomycetota bacterium]